MTLENEIVVNHHFMLDLYFRVTKGMLAHDIYSIEFIEWVKAGIAYNNQGQYDATRCVNYFCSLIEQLESDTPERFVESFKVAVNRFYEDLFNLYLEHVTANFKLSGEKSHGSKIVIPELLLLPRFSATSWLEELLGKTEVNVSNYEVKNRIEFENRIPSVSLAPETKLYRGMSLMYDCGIKKSNGGTILEVC